MAKLTKTYYDFGINRFEQRSGLPDIDIKRNKIIEKLKKTAEIIDELKAKDINQEIYFKDLSL